MAEIAGAKFLSQADFARHRGVSRKAVTGWKQKGILILNDAGLIDVEATEWALDQRPSSYRGGVTHRAVRGRDGNNATQAEARPKPKPSPPAAAPPPVQSRPAEDLGDEDEPESDPHNLPLAKAVQRKENYLGLTRKQAFEKGERTLVDRALAEALFFDTARDNRDAWLNWPARVAVEMAGELGLDARTLTTVLTAHVHKHLAELGEPDADFAEETAAGDLH